MLSNIRKYTGLMFVVLILLFVGLVFLETGGRPSGYGSGPTMIEIDGRGYPQQEFDRVSTNPLRLLSDLSNQSFPARFALAPYLFQLATPVDARSNDPDPRYFLVNRLNLQKAGREIGIYPSVSEVEELIRERIFVNQDQTFNADAYARYVDKSLPRLGMSVKDMNDVLREVLILERLQDVLGAGLQASRSAVKEMIADREQEVSYQLVAFPASKYEAEEDPAEEEVKTYWEENRGRYLSDAKRRVTYVIAQPDFDQMLKEKREKAAAEKAAEEPSQAAPPEGEEAGAAGEAEAEPTEAEAAAEAAAPAEGEAAEPAAAEEAAPAEGEDAAEGEGEEPAAEEKLEEKIELTNEEKDTAIKAEAVRIDNFWVALQDAEGEGFEAKAAEAGLEINTTALFTKDAPPAQFRLATETLSRKRVVDEIFDASMGSRTMDAISNVLPLPNNQYLVFRLDEVVDAVEKTYEEAKEEARLDLVKERARTKMTEAAEAARKAVLEAMEGGKSFADAAKEQGFEPVAREAVKRDTRPPGEPTPDELFSIASKVNPGELSEVVTQNIESRSVFRALFLHIDKRELVETALEDSAVEQELNRMNNTYRQIALQNWLTQQYNKSAVVIPTP